MKTTTKENTVIKAFTKDEYISNLTDSTWSNDFAARNDICTASFPGILASLVKKGIAWTNGSNFGLTEKGQELAEEITKEKEMDFADEFEMKMADLEEDTEAQEEEKRRLGF